MWEEEKIFEGHAIDTYKDSCSVGQVPIEQSFLFFNFMETRNNQISPEVNDGKNGLIVPWICHVNGNKKHIETFSEEINKLKKGKTIYMNRKISEIRKRIFL